MKKNKKPKATLPSEGLAVRLFHSAEMFAASSMALTQTASRNTALLQLPANVLAAFALELYLKCLICIEGKPVIYEHRLDVLFDQLSETNKKTIKGAWEEKFATDRKIIETMAKNTDAIEKKIGVKIDPRKILGFGDFDATLKKSANAFEALRYIHEALSEKCNWSAGLILVCVRERIIALKGYGQPQFTEIR